MSDKLKMHSPNLVDANIEKIAALFPNCVTEAQGENGELKKAVDFDLLKQELSQVLVEGEQERYRLDWVGKKEAILTANAPIAKTLRPCREESVSFDTTENLFIEGDNLEALKLLQENYLGKIKIIYIDPPYNTGNDFIYEDDFTESTDAFFEKSNQIDEEGNRLIANTESNGRFHSDWLSMMYGRLKLARNLLSDDGVMFISIDDNEYHNLKKICDEIFGENSNKTITVKMSEASGLKMGGVIKNGTIPKLKEYVLVIKKNGGVNGLFFDKIEKDNWDKEYNIYLENFSLEEKKIINEMSERENISDDDISILDEIVSKISLLSVSEKFNSLNLKETEKEKWLFDNAWRICQSATSASVLQLANKKKGFNKNLLFFVKSSTGILYLVKSDYSSDSKKPRLQMIFADQNLSVHPGDFWGHIKTTGLDNEGYVPFKNGKKPLALLKALIKSNIGNDKNAIVLDFFAGSSSTAEAILQLNSTMEYELKFIQIQIPEDLNRSYALSSGSTKKQVKETLDFLKANNLPEYLTELGKERIRRAGKKILDDNKDREGIENLDIGFRVLKIDSTNMKDVYYTPDALKQSNLLDLASNIKEDRTSEDLLFQVMLDWGLELSLPIERKNIAEKEVFYVAGNSLVACFDDLTFDVVDEVAKDYPLRFVSAEKSIHLDHDKTNIKERFKQLSSDTEVKFL
ncbi:MULTISPECIES: site-specific DNA-methyltransferase [Acinetobacter]|nr:MULTISPECIES: site-specific DNA-methyltransferase [Acinetobacter]WLF72356.1 site-specific DNA-methyltransferase [Acinetobacter junii]